jgi:hypothetical protein
MFAVLLIFAVMASWYSQVSVYLLSDKLHLQEKRLFSKTMLSVQPQTALDAVKRTGGMHMEPAQSSAC